MTACGSSRWPSALLGEQVVDATGNAVTETILERRSIRAYSSRNPIDRAILDAVVRCGLAAPSSKNAQPWRLHVVDDPVELDEIATMVEAAQGRDGFVPADPRTGRPRADWDSTVLESAAVLRAVPCGIFIENRAPFSRGRKVLSVADRRHLPDLLLGYSLEILGIGTAVENLWIGARSFGLEGAFLGDVLIAEADIASRLSMEGDLVGVLALGWTREAAGGPVDAVRNPNRDPDPEQLVVWHGPRCPAQE